MDGVALCYVCHSSNSNTEQVFSLDVSTAASLRASLMRWEADTGRFRCHSWTLALALAQPQPLRALEDSYLSFPVLHPFVHFPSFGFILLYYVFLLGL